MYTTSTLYTFTPNPVHLSPALPFTHYMAMIIMNLLHNSSHALGLNLLMKQATTASGRDESRHNDGESLLCT